MINGVGKIGEGVPRRYTTGEEIVNSITHGIGSALAIAGTAVLIVFAAIYSDAWGVVGSAIFGASYIGDIPTRSPAGTVSSSMGSSSR